MDTWTRKKNATGHLTKWRPDRAKGNSARNGRRTAAARGHVNKNPQVEAKIKDRHDKVLSDETAARLPTRCPTFGTPSSPRLCTTGTRGLGFTGEMLDLLDRDTRGRDPPHPPFSAPRSAPPASTLPLGYVRA